MFAGFVSHLPAGLLIFLTGVWGKLKKRRRPGEWAAAAAILLASYAGAIALVNLWFGRSDAGYYAVTLPLSGIYLWRYTWLWRHKTRLLLQDLFTPGHEVRLRRMRKQLLAQVEAARDAYCGHARPCPLNNCGLEFFSFFPLLGERVAIPRSGRAG